MGIDIRKYASKGKFYKLEEVFDEPAREQIAIIKDGQFDRLNLVFESGRQVGLNKTSVGELMREFGDDEKDWIGRFVLLTAGQVKNQFGEPTDALIVRPADAASLPAKLPKPKARPSGADMDDEIPF
jgi:hypothetical protein